MNIEYTEYLDNKKLAREIEMTKVTIRTKKYETRAKAEWRYFCEAMLDGKHCPKSVLAVMTDERKIESAKRWLNGPTKSQKAQSNSRQQYINASKEIDNEIKMMSSQSGFLSNDGHN